MYIFILKISSFSFGKLRRENRMSDMCPEKSYLSIHISNFSSEKIRGMQQLTEEITL